MASFLVRKLKLQDSGENTSKILAGRHNFPLVYKVWLELDGGQYPTDFVNVTLGDEDTTELPVPEKEGFRLEGWYSDSTFTVKVTKFSPDVTRLYAKWEEVHVIELDFPNQFTSLNASQTLITDCPYTLEQFADSTFTATMYGGHMGPSGNLPYPGISGYPFMRNENQVDVQFNCEDGEYMKFVTIKLQIIDGNLVGSMLEKKYCSVTEPTYAPGKDYNTMSNILNNPTAQYYIKDIHTVTPV